MIPADIDNFIVIGISCGLSINDIYVSESTKYIPREIGNCTLLKTLFLSNDEISDTSSLSNRVLLESLYFYGCDIVGIYAQTSCT